ncbi:MAG: HigA family addiction module antitoxin [Nitrospinae bacterium]|nr:HigA family addiction module antitoxin [Nitrospinota bacterium]
MRKKELTAGARGMRASHPGEAWGAILKEGLGLSVSEAAKRMGISRQRLHAVIREKAPERVTPNLALRFTRLCGKDDEAAKLWLRMQMTYDLEAAKRELTDVLPGIEPASPPKDTVSV